MFQIINRTFGDFILGMLPYLFYACVIIVLLLFVDSTEKKVFSFIGAFFCLFPEKKEPPPSFKVFLLIFNETIC